MEYTGNLQHCSVLISNSDFTLESFRIHEISPRINLTDHDVIHGRMDNDVTLQEQIFHNAVREVIVS